MLQCFVDSKAKAGLCAGWNVGKRLLQMLHLNSTMLLNIRCTPNMCSNIERRKVARFLAVRMGTCSSAQMQTGDGMPSAGATTCHMS